MVSELVDAKLLEQAYDVAYAIGDDEQRSHALTAVACGYADMGRFHEAFSSVADGAIGGYGFWDNRVSEGLVYYMKSISQWIPSIERMGRGASVLFLREAASVARWADPRWERVYQILSVNDLLVP